MSRRLGLVLVVLSAVIGGLLLASAMQVQAARRPTEHERADVARALMTRLEHDAPAVTLRVKSVVVSTKRPGPHSIYSRFALARASGRDRSGHLIGSPLQGLAGFSRRFRTWVVIDYGSTEVGCEPVVFFGGRDRRAAILRDLGLGCP